MSSNSPNHLTKFGAVVSLLGVLLACDPLSPHPIHGMELRLQRRGRGRVPKLEFLPLRVR